VEEISFLKEKMQYASKTIRELELKIEKIHTDRANAR